MSLRNDEWNRLDNVANIFPPTSDERNTKVFRFACELYEPINPKILQISLDKTINEFPFFCSVLKKGLFWYYLENSDLKPMVKSESKPPCSPIYDRNSKNLLFEVTYYKSRINFEVYHVLTDGTGALQFLRYLVYNYLVLSHKAEFENKTPILDYDASITQKADDSFQKYCTKGFKLFNNKKVSAFQIKGTKIPENRIKVIEGVVPIKKILDEAHKYNTTLTAFLTAVLMCSIYKEMAEREKTKPVVVAVPINLRKYFPSETTRNFFSLMDVDYNFKKNSDKLEDVIQYLNENFRRELTKEKIKEKINTFATLESNIVTRVTPLFLKNILLKLSSRYLFSDTTASLSNVGKVEMPDEVSSYIRLFDVFISTSKLQICCCSFKDNLTISFTSAFLSTDIQKNFFRTLTDIGISVEISANTID